MEEKLIDENFLQQLLSQMPSPEKLSYRSNRLKQEITRILEKKEMITAKELSQILHLSRNRCAEYLVSLEREGKIIGFRVGRKKYYKAKR